LGFNWQEPPVKLAVLAWHWDLPKYWPEQLPFGKSALVGVGLGKLVGVTVGTTGTEVGTTEEAVHQLHFQ